MALVAIQGGLWIPSPKVPGTNAPANNASIAINASGDRVALICKAPKTGTIDRVLISVGAVVTALPLDVRLETVNTTTAHPTGTLFGTNTSATTGTPTADTQIEVTLTAGASVTAGDVFAIVVQANSTPIDVTMLCTNGTLMAGTGFPYGSHNQTGSYAVSTSHPCYGVRYSSPAAYAFLGPGVLPINSIATTSFNTTTGASTGTRRGLHFELPFPATLSGCWLKMAAGASADFTIKLYDGAGGSALQTMSVFDATQQGSTSTATLWFITFTTPYDLVAATPYRLTVDADTVNSLSLYELSVDAAAYMDAFEGGQAFHLTKFVSSAWAEVTTERPFMGLFLSAFDDGTGGGSGEVSHVFVG